MIALNGQPGELSFTLQITRAATGKVEEYQVTGYLDPEKLQQLTDEQPTEDQSNGRHS